MYAVQNSVDFPEGEREIAKVFSGWLEKSMPCFRKVIGIEV